jgi:hypothetical protein
LQTSTSMDRTVIAPDAALREQRALARRSLPFFRHRVR